MSAASTMNIPRPAVSTVFDLDDVREAWNTIMEPGQVTEVRIFEGTTTANSWPKILAGYFDDVEKLISELRKVRSAAAICIIPNPNKPELIARANNRIREAKKGESTGDHHIVYRRWLLIDCDAVRASGISSKDAEHEEAIERVKAIAATLRLLGWPEPIMGDSGNGAHLMYRIDLPCDDGGIIDRILVRLQKEHGDDAVAIDQTSKNPSRLWKFYGTKVCKGDNTEDRPHRFSKLISVPVELATVTREQLEAYAQPVEAESVTPAAKSKASSRSYGDKFDLAGWLSRYGVPVGPAAPWKGGGVIYEFDTCPWNSDHNNREAYVGQKPDGTLIAGCHHNSCTWQWRDLRDKYEPTKSTGTSSTGAKTASPNTSDQISRLFVGPPISLDAPLPPAVPAGLIPGPIGEFVDALAAETETPTGLPASLVLAGIAMPVHRTFTVKVETNYFEPLSIWVAPALEPGSRKTAVFKRIIAPHAEWERIKGQDIEKSIKRAESEAKTAKAKIEKLRAKAAGANAAEYTTIVNEIAELEVNMPEIPTRPRLIAQDITPEHTATVMAQNGGAIGIMDDEAGIFATIAGRYSNNVANTDLFNKAHSGSHVRVDRGSRPSISIDHPRLTFGISPQPFIFSKMNKNEQLKLSGFIDRFFCMLPESRLGYRKLEQHPVPPNLLAAYRQTILDLADIQLNNVDGEAVPHVLTLNVDAWSLWKEWQREIEVMLRPGEKLEKLRGWGGKLAGGTARIAALMHCGLKSFTAVAQREISADTMQRAIQLARIYVDHALIVFDAMGVDDAATAARELWRVITDLKKETFSAREAWLPLRGRYQRVGEVEGGFEKLIDHNLIGELDTADMRQRGRPSRQFRVHPEISEDWK